MSSSSTSVAKGGGCAAAGADPAVPAALEAVLLPPAARRPRWDRAGLAAYYLEQFGLWSRRSGIHMLSDCADGGSKAGGWPCAWSGGGDGGCDKVSAFSRVSDGE